jgi:hypothetical protein
VGEIVGIGRKAKMEEFYAFVGRLDDYKEGLVIGMCFLLIVAHSRLKTRDWGFIVMSVVFVVLSASAFIAELFLADPTVFFWQFVTLLVAYGTGVYIFMCDVLIFGGAKYLTRRWGDTWVKALDYPYLVFGCLGVLASVNRLDIIKGGVSRIYILGPLVVTTAVVIRFVKTRAEIGGWNKATGITDTSF